jgi:lysozyme
MSIRAMIAAMTRTAKTGAIGKMKTSAKGIEIIHSFEGLRLDAYLCPAKVWTIGWGATADEQGKPIKPSDKWTRERADARFLQHLASFEADVHRLLDGAPVTQGQFDALVSFTYNLGAGNLAKSTLLRRHKAGEYGSAAIEFAKWSNAGGRKLQGLVRRRAAEAKLYRGQ